MDKLKIERIGGFAGFGLPGSKLESRGETAMSSLSATDQSAVDALFQRSSRATASSNTRDGFRYRLTRGVGGREQTVEVPEDAVPPAVKAAVVDTLN